MTPGPKEIRPGPKKHVEVQEKGAKVQKHASHYKPCNVYSNPQDNAETIQFTTKLQGLDISFLHLFGGFCRPKICRKHLLKAQQDPYGNTVH